MFSLTGDDINSIIGYVATIFGDIKILVFLLIGIPLGLFIVERIISALFNKKTEDV